MMQIELQNAKSMERTSNRIHPCGGYMAQIVSVQRFNIQYKTKKENKKKKTAHEMRWYLKTQ